MTMDMGPAHDADRTKGVAAFDVAPDEELRDRLRSCCAAEDWVQRMLGGRPYGSEAALYAASDDATATLGADALAQALGGHPRIGDAPGGHGADRRSAEWSQGEQAGVATAGDGLRDELAAANAEYERRFGHVYLVCATGREAAELLSICRSRLDNDAVIERAVVLGELAKINRLRLAKLLAEWAG
jgi:2-oxo-4-hydroxy-4-carboxy-5-ureidoimidazoline decarboxylase